jgi:hypothetical protein
MPWRRYGQWRQRPCIRWWMTSFTIRPAYHYRKSSNRYMTMLGGPNSLCGFEEAVRPVVILLSITDYGLRNIFHLLNGNLYVMEIHSSLLGFRYKQLQSRKLRSGFWRPCSFVNRYQICGGYYCFHLQGRQFFYPKVGDDRYIRNDGTYLPNYRVTSQNTVILYSLPWER